LLPPGFARKEIEDIAGSRNLLLQHLLPNQHAPVFLIGRWRVFLLVREGEDVRLGETGTVVAGSGVQIIKYAAICEQICCSAQPYCCGYKALRWADANSQDICDDMKLTI
jgi:hypothetical protein